jgi:hypothetical protein
MRQIYYKYFIFDETELSKNLLIDETEFIINISIIDETDLL